VLGLLLAAATIRLAGLTSEPFWIDEILSIDLSSGQVPEILRANALDTHPPLYYLGLAGWRKLVGSSEGQIRGFSVAWSLVGLVATFLLGRALGGGGCGLAHWRLRSWR
jgi:uncharacterized membrane protein